MAQDALRTLYDNLKRENYDVPDNYDSFARTLNNDKNARVTLYNSLKQNNYDVPVSYDSFDKTLWPSATGSVWDWGKGTMAKVKQAKREKNEGSWLGRAVNKVGDTYDKGAIRREKKETEERMNSLPATMRAGRKTIQEIQKGKHKDADSAIQSYKEHYGEERMADYNRKWNTIEERRATRNAINEEGLAGDIDRALNARVEELAEIDRKRQAGRSFGQQMIHGLANAEAGPSGGYNSEYLNDLSADPAARQLRAAKSLMDDAKDIVREADIAANEGTYAQWIDKNSFLSGAARGFANKVGKISTWDFGISDVLNSLEVKSALDKFDKGKELSKEENMLLEALATKTAVEGYFGSGLGRGYKAGGVTAEALPFMLEMAANPLSRVGGAAAKSFAKWVGKRYGVELGKGLVKQGIKKGTAAALRTGSVATRQAGNVLGATGMALTSGQGRVRADMLERERGEVTPTYNKETGRFEIAEHKAGDDGLTAYLKALGNATIENYSEMMFGNAGGKLTKGLRNRVFGASKVGQWLDKVSASKFSKGLNNFLKKTQWHGPIEEYLEEVGGNLLNALTVGDMTLDTAEGTGVFNLDQNVDTFLGVGLMGGVISTIRTAGYFPSRHNANKRVAAADANGQRLFGDNWSGIKEAMEGATEGTLKDVVTNALNGAGTQEQKQAVLGYAQAMQNRNGTEVALAKLAEEQTPEQTESRDAYDNGYSIEGESEMRSAKLGFDRATRVLSDAGYDMNELEAMANDGRIYSALSSGVYGDQQEAVREWVVARATYEGMLGRVRDDIDNQVQASNEEIDQRVAKPEQGGDGMIHPAILKDGTNEEGRPVHIIGGNVVMLDDGSGVDIDKSDKDILVRDPQTGKVEFVDIKDIANTDAPLDAEQVKQETAAAITEQLATEAGDKMDGTVKVGNTYTVTDGEGLEHTITVLEDNGDGNLVVQEEGKEPYAMPMTYLQQMVDAEAMKQTEQSPIAEASSEQVIDNGVQETSEQTPTQESEQVGEQAEEETPEVKAHRELYGDERFDKASADELVQNNINAAKKEVKKAEAEMKKPNLETDREKYLKKLEQRREKLATAQANLDYWTKIQEVENARVQAEQEAAKAEQEAAAAERAAQDEATYQQAVADEEAYQAEQLAKQQEQAERGPFTVGSNVVEKWQQSPKVEGYENEITLPNGEKITGRYMLVESGAATPSHNANMEFVKNEGFPVDENGNTVNDRDYERDKDAQEITRDTANHYDARAIQNVPVVSNDGVVLSGNGRTMAGELAAEQGTDGAYVEHLTKYGRQFGFTPEQVSAMQHPRVVFVPDEAMPYTAETFAKFNAQEMKGQNKTEQAVKLGKVVDDATFHRIINSINEFDTLGDFYADQKASVGAINELRDAGVINAMQYGEMFDGEKLADAGRNMIENMLIGKAFESNPDAIRQLTKYKSLRQSVVNALAEISNNVGLGEDYSLEAELAEAIKLAYEARNAGRKSGEKVSAYARQMNLFAFDNGETVADYTNLTILMLADVLNDNRVNQLKKTLAMYNKEAQDNADGQMDIFSGGVKSKEDILNEILELLNYGTKEEIEKRLADANKRGTEQTSEEAGEQQSVDEAGVVGESGESVEPGTDSGRETDAERQGDLAQAPKLKYELSDEVDENGRQFVLTTDGNLEFGEIGADTGLTAAPILLSEGMITNTETNDGYGLVHIEARHGDQIRNAGYNSIIEFIEEVARNYEVIREGNNRDGVQTYMLQLTDKHNNTLMVELSGDGTYWNINTAGIFKTSYGAKRNVVYNRHTTDKQSAETAEASLSGEQSGTTPSTSMNAPTQTSNDVSEGKVSEEEGEKQEKVEENEENSGENANFVLTLDALEASDLDEAVKSGARAWLQGEQTPANQLSYLIAEDYVRNRSVDNERSGGNADTPQLGGEDNGAAVGEDGRADGAGGPVDNRGNGEEASEERPSGQDRSGSVAAGNGEGSDSGLFGEEPDDAVEAANGKSKRGGSNRRNGRSGKSGRRSRSEGVSASDASGNARATAQSQLEEALDDFWKTLGEDFTKPTEGKLLAVDPISLYTFLGGVKAAKVFTAGVKVAYYAVKVGCYEFNDWFKLMRSKLADGLSRMTGMSDEQIDGFIEMMWGYSMTINGETHKVSEWASLLGEQALRDQMRMTLDEKRKLQQEAEATDTIVGDLANIRESLPFLLPKQQEDVQKAEHQFFDESHADAAHGNGKGYMFTNGTGTGKTYTGLGIVKRFLKQGKGRVLIVTASETKIKDWIKDAKNLGIEASMLPDTKSKGTGVVVTQYANMRQNQALLEDEFDLIVYDESHKLMENMNGEVTSASIAHHMLSNRDERQAARRIVMTSEFGKELLAAKNQLDLLIEALNTETSNWSEEVKKAVQDAGGPSSVRSRVDELKEIVNKSEERIEEEVDKVLADPEQAAKMRDAVKKTKVVFLSATPYNTPANLDYVESYIFSYPGHEELITEEKRLDMRGGFLMDNFSSSHQRSAKSRAVSRIAQERIADPMKASEEEVAFSDHLQNELHTMSGRDLDSEWDYSREFPELEFPLADTFNDAIQSLSDGRYNVLAEYFDHLLRDYNTMTGYLEIFKAQMIAPRIREYISLGKKVTLYHRRKNSNTDMYPPFNYAMEKAELVAKKEGNNALMTAVNGFRKAYSRLFAWEQTIDYKFPQDTLLREFMTQQEKDNYDKAEREWHEKYDEDMRKLEAESMLLAIEVDGETGADKKRIESRIKEVQREINKIMRAHPKPKCAMVGVFNGTEAQKDRAEAVQKFNDDANTEKLLVVQVQSGKEGISLHDTTGTYPRVQIGIFLPQSPIEFIQTEGRIFRVGNQSNAIFEYPLLGLDIELSNFAQKINGRSETTENLALGSRGRGLKESISRAALASRKISPKDATGTGGKDLDNRKTQHADGFDAAMKNYAEWRGEEKPSDLNDIEVPDPIGYMMAQWSRPENGERVLVPRARRGSVARYVPTSSRLTTLEKRNKDYARLSALVGGSGREVKNEDFEDYSQVNKADAVVLNTRHGKGVAKGLQLTEPNALDTDDVIKAMRHLEDSGRIVALVSSEAASQIDSQLSQGGAFVKVGEVKLPNFVLNGTPSSIVIIDKVENKEIRSKLGAPMVNDLSSTADEQTLFAQIRQIAAPARNIDKQGKIRKRMRGLVTKFVNTGTLSKSKSWRTGKMEPNINVDGYRFSVSFARGKMGLKSGPGYYTTYFTIDYEDIADNNTSYIQSLAKNWKLYDEQLKYDDDRLFEAYRSYIDWNRDRLDGVRDTLRCVNEAIETALNKTPMQLRNIAEGKVENEVSGSYDLQGFREVFDSLNPEDAELEALADKVFEAVGQIEGLQFKVVPADQFGGKHNVVAHYVPSRNIIELNSGHFNSIRLTDQMKAQTVVHEMIHAVTCWAIETYKDEDKRHLLSAEQQQACKDIIDVYAQINNDAFRNELRKNSEIGDNAEYGLTNEEEMMAELSNPVFRAMLKAKKLWRQVINSVKMLLGMEIPGVENEESDALSILDNALETLMNSFDPDLYKQYTNGGGWANSEFNMAIGRRYSYGAPYQGSKGKIADKLIDRLPEGKRFVDLFSGGGAMTHAAIESGKYDSYQMNDIDGTGQELFMQGIRGEWEDYDRTEMTEDEFKQIKGTPESLVWSFGGLGRNIAKDKGFKHALGSIGRMKNLGKLKSEADKVSTSNEDYRNVELKQGDVVYADIPYESTDTRGYGKGAKFDKQAFSDWALSQDVPIYVSESVMPEGWAEIYSMPHHNLRQGVRQEKLWVQEKFAVDAEQRDSEYMSAVEAGDMAKAEQMVKAAAKAAMPDTKVVDKDGEPLVVYNANAVIEEAEWDRWKDRPFKRRINIYDRKIAESGFWFSNSYDFARNWVEDWTEFDPERVNAVYLDMKKPLIVDAKFNRWTSIKNEQTGTYMGSYELAEYAEKNGYDGLIIRNVEEGDSEYTKTVVDDYVVFSPNQIKSADPVTYDDNGNVIPLSERFDFNKDDIRYRLEDGEKPTFYSNAEKAVEGIKQNKATAEQWKAMLTKAGGIKAGEDKWMGLSAWLDENKGKSLTKDEVLQFVRDNGIQMEEVNYGDVSRIIDKYRDEFKTLIEQAKTNGIKTPSERGRWAFEQMVKRHGDWYRDSAYVVDMGSNESVLGHHDSLVENLGIDNAIDGTRLPYTTKGLGNKREIAFVVPNVESYQEGDSIHFGEENEGKAIMWVRFGETIDADGKRVLVIDEIQSNRHQDAREKGYQSKETAEIRRKRDALHDRLWELWDKIVNENSTQAESKEYDRLNKEWEELDNRLRELTDKGVPAAPFEKNWHEVAMKRMLRLAAEEGFDKVAWTTGEQQAERYGIGNAVREISSGITLDGERTMHIHLKSAPLMEFDFDDDGRIYRMNTEAQQYFSGAENISDVVGKEIASEALSIQGEGIGNVKKWSGDGLRIGGSGMKGFYDKMLPRFMDKYGKKWGVKTGTVELPNVEEAGRTMHSIDVTPEMKASVMQGQPLFREVLSEGGELRILQDGSSTWRIEGMPGAYPSREAAIDAFREYAYGSIWDISDDGERIEVLGRGDMMAQMTGRTSKKDAARREKWAQERAKRSRKDIDNLCKRLGVQVNYVDDLSTAERGKLTEHQQKAKGWYNPRTGEVWINMGNHNSYNDIMATFLHEVVAHKGLRKLFGEDFNTFLDNVYANADEGIRREIARMAARKGWDFREATEEYMARLAESMELDNPHKRGLWAMVKGFVIDQLRKLGVKGLSLSDNSLRYILWSSWHNMEQQGVLGAAEDVVMREQLGIGEATAPVAAESQTTQDESGRDDEFGPYWYRPISKEELREYLSGLKERYGVKMAGDSYAIYDDEDLESLREELSEELFNELEQSFHSTDEVGAHSMFDKKTFVFTNKRRTRQQAEHTWWHEYGHEAFDYIEMDDKVECAFEALEWLKEKEVVTDEYMKKYRKLDQPSEATALLVGYVFDMCDAEGLLNGNFVGNEKIAKLAAAIQNYFKNGEEETETDNRFGGRDRRIEKMETGPRDGLLQKPGRGQEVKNEQGEEGETVAESDDGLRYRDDDGADEDYDAGATTYEEGVTGALLKAASDNRAALSARVTAMRALGGNLSKLRSAMAQQREYDRKTVDAIVRLAKQVLNSGFFKSLSRYEVNRLMGMVNRAVGKEDITKQAGEVVDMLLDHQMKACADMLHKQISIRGSKLNAKGVEVQGVLDIKGQRMVEAMKEGMELDEESLGNRLSEVSERMGDDNKVVADNAAIEYQGLMLAKQYLEDIKSSEVEENELKKELRTAKEDKAAGRLDKDSYNEFVKDTGDAIRENRLERIEAYSRLMQSLGEGLGTSIERAKAWREANERRVREIQHDANSDLQGMEVTELGKMPEKRGVRHSIVQFLMQPLVTANEMLRDLGSKHVNGEGYLWNRFIGGWRAASDREQRKLQEAYDELADKVSTVMGKKMRWSDLFSMERKMEGMEVVMYDGGMPKSFHLTQGNMLYIYMVNKMTDGKMKLRKMGITEEKVEAIKSQIDPRFIELADWIQEEFLVNKREEYNEVYERMFGAPMAAIDNYITLNINDRSRGKQEDVSNYLDDDHIGSTITGSVIKRTRNAQAIDVTGTDAFDLVLDHLQKMEHWAAFGELNRDLGTLVSYKRFRNRLMQMKSTRFGTGKEYWNNFKTCCAILSGSYRPKTRKGGVDDALVNIGKGVTASKIAFRLYTAFKQLLSSPAYLSEASIGSLIKNNPITGGAKAWNWAMKELPGFAERWNSRISGDSRLLDTESDWKWWHKGFVEKMNKWGMSPNAFVDAITVACGARAMYETKLRQNLAKGFTKEEANKRALRDASISYNETQQSSEDAFISAMQLDRTATSVAFTVFRNCSMGYQRRLFRAMKNLQRRMQKGYKEESIDFMTKQLVRELGYQEVAELPAEAVEAVKKEYDKRLWRDMADVAIFGWVLQFAWNLGPYLAYLIGGDDDDDKLRMLSDAAIHALFGGVEGLTGGESISNYLNDKLQGKTKSYGVSDYIKLMPMLSDVDSMLDHFDSDWALGATDLINLLVASNVGVNPQTISDVVVAIADACHGDMGAMQETGFALMRILQFPQKEVVDRFLVDELGITPEGADGIDAATLAQRYADYRRRRYAPLTGALYSGEQQEKVEQKGVKRFKSMVREKLENLSEDELLNWESDDEFLHDIWKKSMAKIVPDMSDESLRDAMESNDNIDVRKKVGNEIAKRVEPEDDKAKNPYGSDDAKYNQIYAAHQTWEDVAEDEILSYAERRLKKSDPVTSKRIAAARKRLTKVRARLANGYREDVMEAYREARRQVIEAFGL